MKTTKFLAMLLSAFALSFTFSSCGDDDDDVPTPPDNKYAQQIVGTWKVAEWSYDNSTDDGYVDFYDVTYTFSSDGKVENKAISRREDNRSYSDGKGAWSENVNWTYGTYTVDGHNLHMVFNHAKGEYKDYARHLENGEYKWEHGGSSFNNDQYHSEESVVIVSIEGNNMVIEAVASDPQWQGRKETLHLTRI